MVRGQGKVRQGKARQGKGDDGGGVFLISTQKVREKLEIPFCSLISLFFSPFYCFAREQEVFFQFPFFNVGT